MSREIRIAEKEILESVVEQAKGNLEKAASIIGEDYDVLIERLEDLDIRK